MQTKRRHQLEINRKLEDRAKKQGSCVSETSARQGLMLGHKPAWLLVRGYDGTTHTPRMKKLRENFKAASREGSIQWTSLSSERVGGSPRPQRTCSKRGLTSSIVNKSTRGVQGSPVANK